MGMRRNHKNRTGIGVISFVVLIICGIVTYRGFGLTREKSDYEVKINRLKTQIEEQKERAVDIKNMEKYVQSKEYIEKIAREKLGLVNKGDVLFKAEK